MNENFLLNITMLFFGLSITHPEHDLMKSDVTIPNQSSINASRFPPISFPRMLNANIARLLCKPIPLNTFPHTQIVTLSCRQINPAPLLLSAPAPSFVS